MTSTETVTKTVVLPLQTSERKNQRVQQVIEEWQNVARRMAELMLSFPDYRWDNAQDTHFYRLMKKEFPELNIRAQTAQQAMAKASESFSSWKSNGKRGDSPIGDFGNGDYARFHNQGYNIEGNERGFGAKIKLHPYNPEWFHIGTMADYHTEILENIVDGHFKRGSAELRLREDRLSLAISYSEEIEVYEPDEVECTVGVDVGEKMLYSVAVMNDGEVEEVELESGEEFRHHRERFDKKKDRFQRNDNLRMVHQISGERERYTEQVLDTASRRIVDLATEYTPCVIKLEDLNGYRETAEDPIHDMPYGIFREKVLYKAKESGIPVETVDSYYTSLRCRKCEHTDEDNRLDRNSFLCNECGYEVHADVNAAMNIAQS